MNPTDYGRSVIRTVVPILVGSVISWLASRGVKVDEATILPMIDAAVAAIYYAGVRALEHRFPRAGWLLGSPGAPSYSGAPASAPIGPVPVNVSAPNESTPPVSVSADGPAPEGLPS